jgi:hypothetical protein
VLQLKHSNWAVLQIEKSREAPSSVPNRGLEGIRLPLDMGSYKNSAIETDFVPLSKYVVSS